MKRYLLTAVFFLACTSLAQARGLLIPSEPDVAPLAMLNHRVDATLEDQLTVTKVVQTFRNHTEHKLEATYVFPVPAGASVQKFVMWVDGKRSKGELLKADKAKKMYTDIVRRTKEPAILEYIGTDLLTMKIYPVPAKGDLKVEVSFTAIAKKENDLVQYVYPLKTDRMAASTLEEFRLTLTLKSQQPIGGIYSPTHEITINRNGDHQAVVRYEKIGGSLDRDFQLFYTTSGEDIGLTALQHRPISGDDGYVALLVSPRAELAKDQKVPRDIVFVVDTSGSMMKNKKIEQAKKALKHCLSELSPQDRFGLVGFATTVDRYREKLAPVNEEHIKRAKGWVSDLYAGGGTAIEEALQSALKMRGDDESRMFTIVFFTDGQPTIGETDTDKILANLTKDKTAGTRIFSFGIGDDLDAVFLDQIAEQTRAVSRYVRSGENLEARVASFFTKINHPVLANLKLTSSGDVRLLEVYPPQLPDLFHGDQLVVLARYHGAGKASIVLDGKIGIHDKQYVYKIDFQASTDEKPFVEQLWARRKVGYLLDQIRINGEKTELVEEVVRLAKNYGITTPYTSYLIMPDAPLQIVSAGKTAMAGGRRHYAPAALAPGKDGKKEKQKLADFARNVQRKAGDLAKNRGAFQDRAFGNLADSYAEGAGSPADKADHSRLLEAKRLKSTLDLAQANYKYGRWRANRVNKLGVDLAICTNALKCQSQLQATALRRVASRSCMEIGGVWIDESFNAKTPTVLVKAQSDAYFRILERQPQMREVFQLGNHVLWITPNGTALVVDTSGKDKLSDKEIDLLFVSK